MSLSCFFKCVLRFVHFLNLVTPVFLYSRQNNPAQYFYHLVLCLFLSIATKPLHYFPHTSSLSLALFIFLFPGVSFQTPPSYPADCCCLGCCAFFSLLACYPCLSVCLFVLEIKTMAQLMLGKGCTADLYTSSFFNSKILKTIHFFFLILVTYCYFIT